MDGVLGMTVVFLCVSVLTCCVVGHWSQPLLLGLPGSVPPTAVPKEVPLSRVLIRWSLVVLGKECVFSSSSQRSVYISEGLHVMP